MILSRLRALDRQGRPIRVAVVGAGQMGSGVIRQLTRLPGVRVVAVCDRVPQRAWEAVNATGLVGEFVQSTDEAWRVVEDGRVALASEPSVVVSAAQAVVEATGDPEGGCRIALLTLRERKTLVTMNVELDATVGPILAYLFRAAETAYTVGLGDEPAVLCEMVDFTRAMGLEVVCAGKGKNNRLDRDATPATVSSEAARWGMSPRMLAAFVDGTKTMMEMAALGNATGLTVDCAGMHGPVVSRDELVRVFVPEANGGILTRRGVVDYAIGNVAPGVFVVVRADDESIRRDLEYLRMGSGPYYALYRPFHLANLEVPLSVARAVLDGEVTMQAQGAPLVECVAVAKRDLASGEELDGIGGETVYGLADEAERARAAGAVPIGIVSGARTRREIRKGEVLTYDDVQLNEESIVVQLRRLQDVLVLSGVLV